MTEGLRTVTRLIDLIKNSKLSSRTNDMLEYLLYQLNLAMMSEMLRGRRFVPEVSAAPYNCAEIEDLNLLILAAESGEINTETADREIMERISVIVERIHAVETNA